MQTSASAPEARALIANDLSWIDHYQEVRRTTDSGSLRKRLKKLDFISLVAAIGDVQPALSDVTEICLYRDWIDAADHDNPQLFAAWFNLGAVCARAGDSKAAMEAYSKACSRNPAFAPAAVNLGL